MQITFRIPYRARYGETLCLYEPDTSFQGWTIRTPLILHCEGEELWTTTVEIDNPCVFEYRYAVLWGSNICRVEQGSKHRFAFSAEERKKGVVVQDYWQDEDYSRVFRSRLFTEVLFPHHPATVRGRFRGSGVAVPVFSLRSEDGCGIGEYQDLKRLAEWARQTGQYIIQTLPVNDTTLTHSNADSYPYSPVSVFALHPIYINITRMGELTGAEMRRYKTAQKRLNSLSYADYQQVYETKSHFFHLLFRRDWPTLCFTSEYKQFFAHNSEWLEPYAAYMAARDGEPAEYYYYLQYHAALQLSESVEYAHSLGVAIKGDIPIGVHPYSVETATQPELFHLNGSAGAPPDDFDERGQNWGFPTYNWEVMAQDGFAWWTRRLRKMQDYFDAYRIDHILGLFRIWQMRRSDVWGLCGHFVPALPYTQDELVRRGLRLDIQRLTRPYLRAAYLSEVLGPDTEFVSRHFLTTQDSDHYVFRPEFDTQQKVAEWFDSGMAEFLPAVQRKRLEPLLMQLLTQVLFVRDQQEENLLHPRIAVYKTYSFRALDDEQKGALMALYDDYYFHRHNEFWRRSAMAKLPQMLASNDMLCCGEDLGMVPACVPEVMKELQILSLEIQRMPKDPTIEFAHPAYAPYLSVCTTGTHDTNPLRAWWEEDRDKTQRYYNGQLGMEGEAPKTLSAKLAEVIVRQHMESPAMWVILPLQDWLAIDAKVRLKDAHAERINVPSDPHNFWCYRMHLTLEQLLGEKSLNRKIQALTALRMH